MLAFSVIGGFDSQDVVVAFRDDCRLDNELRWEYAGPNVIRARLPVYSVSDRKRGRIRGTQDGKSSLRRQRLLVCAGVKLSGCHVYEISIDILAVVVGICYYTG